MTTTPKEAVLHLAERAPVLLKKEGHLELTLFIYGVKGEVAILSMDVLSHDLLHPAMKTIGQNCPLVMPTCVAVVSEAWTTTHVPSGGKSPADMPDAKQVVLVIAQDRQGNSYSATIPFSNVGGEILLDETEYKEKDVAVRSPMLKAFWEGVVNK